MTMNWTEEEEKRQDIIAQNGNDGEHYEEIESASNESSNAPKEALRQKIAKDVKAWLEKGNKIELVPIRKVTLDYYYEKRCYNSIIRHRIEKHRNGKQNSTAEI